MDFRNKKLVITVRILFGLYLLFASIGGLYVFLSPDGMTNVPEEFRAPTQLLLDSGILWVAKGTELIVGLMLVFGLLPALAVLLISPITVGIIVWHLGLAPASLLSAIPMALVNMYLGYVYWDKYKAIFSRK